MATKPSQKLDWATGASTTVEPDAGRKVTGFRTGKKPPARWFNWLFFTIDAWIAYLKDGNFQGACTFDDTVTVTNGIFANGGVASAFYVFTDGAGGVAYKTRTKYISLSNPSPNYLGGQVWYPGSISGGTPSNVEGCYFPGGSTTTSSTTRHAVSLPNGAVLSSLTIGAVPDSSGTVVVRLIRSQHGVGGAAPTETTLATCTTSGAGAQVIPATFSHTVDNTTGTYRLTVTATGTPTVGHTLHSAFVTFGENNPSGNGTI
jgi:hypothetical protein